MAKAESSIDERSANLRDVQGARAGKTQALNITHRRPEYATQEEIVKKEIIRVLGNDRRLALAGDEGAEFILSMGLLVKEPSDRAQLYALCLPYTIQPFRRRMVSK